MKYSSFKHHVKKCKARGGVWPKPKMTPAQLADKLVKEKEEKEEAEMGMRLEGLVGGGGGDEEGYEQMGNFGALT